MMRKRWLWSLLVLAAGVICGVAIERPGAFWTPTREAQEPVPNVDFSLMAIAIRPVIATESGGTANVRVEAQERCVLGYATCDKPQQRTVEAECLGSHTTVVIGEKDWSAFQPIQDEDLKGIENAPKDMRLCAAWEQ